MQRSLMPRTRDQLLHLILDGVLVAVSGKKGTNVHRRRGRSRTRRTASGLVMQRGAL